MIEEPLPDLVCLHSTFFLDPWLSPLPAYSPDYEKAVRRPNSARSAFHKAQSHRPPRIVLVEVDQNDALPGAQQGLAPETGTVTDGPTKAGNKWSAP